jgi:hypothetical protein
MEIELNKIVQNPHQIRTISTDEELWELVSNDNYNYPLTTTRNAH